ncbi:MAG TPA: pyruvate ferredoxin oxidoreductase [Candidatus Altiarchaeales archaeon]|nr:pyruvate ferredoxin oxidoreductase [Candidatus Altiarchaeales archaeon]
MSERKYQALMGNHAAAHAMRQINPDVVPAYPITPQTALMQKFSDFYADGDVDSEMILVESEHSAMSAAVGASAAGARVMTATSANGLALMWEIVYIAASSRLPIVMTVVNRALSGPINIHCDHSDTMGTRDSGWIQIYSENAQEIYENVIQSVRIAEHPDVLLPVMPTMDGFIISHGMESVYLFEDEEVKDFVGEYKPKRSLLDVESPITFGPLDLPDYYFEHKRQQADAMKNALKVIQDVGKEFSQKFGTKEYGLTEGYMLDDAEIVVVGLGSTCGTLRTVVDKLREAGVKAGLLKIRVFRPFPLDEIRGKLSKANAIAVLDRADSFNAVSGPLYSEVKASLYGEVNTPIVNYIYGLGGRDITLEMLEKVYRDLGRITQKGEAEQELTYLGVRD